MIKRLTEEELDILASESSNDFNDFDYEDQQILIKKLIEPLKNQKIRQITNDRGISIYDAIAIYNKTLMME